MFRKCKLSALDTSPNAQYPVGATIEADVGFLTGNGFLPELRDFVAKARDLNHTLELKVHDEEEDALVPMAPSIEEIAVELRGIVERAQADLGKNLGGGSMTDLCADNTLYPLDVIRVAMTVAGLNWEVRNV